MKPSGDTSSSGTLIIGALTPLPITKDTHTSLPYHLVASDVMPCEHATGLSVSHVSQRRDL